MSSRKNPDWGRAVFVVIVLNLLFLDAWIIKTRPNPQNSGAVLPASTSCPSACVQLFNGKSSAKEQVIPISASGTTIESDWSTINGSEITFNKANYPGAKKIYFQANLSSDASDRKSYARLYDATHGIGIQGSEMSTTSTSLKQIQSGEINPFSGDLTIRVQVKSLNGNLVTISNPRIVVIY
jgi:hypothetical protein